MLRETFGKTGVGEAHVYTLENKNHMKVKITDFGAAVVQLWVPDQNHHLRDVVLGYDSAGAYETSTYFMGAVVGRNANRIGGASFKIDGKNYKLDKNDGENNLHSGFDYSNLRLWTVKDYTDQQMTLSMDFPDGFQNFPGNVTLDVTYRLTDDNALSISYEAVCDQTTIINPTNHSYFNLNGHDSGNVDQHRVYIDADAYTAIDAHLIPTGQILSVENTPMDFRTMKTIGRDIDAGTQDLLFANGYDHNWVLNHPGHLRKVAECTGDQSGIRMEIFTDLPGVQMYTGNFLDEKYGKEGCTYQQRSGVCFETQYFPDAPHHNNFPSTFFEAGQRFESTTIYRFMNV